MAKRSLLITPVDAPKGTVAAYVNLEVESSNKYDELRVTAPDGTILAVITVKDGNVVATPKGKFRLPKQEAETPEA